ncbi:MAG: Hsp20/alpha crystallin family protein [Chloroflexi bacterium]|nr:Hsp20/alpha crystallin family protein [Chloroflexota bacterium]MBI3740571.1 Hsp20/alpha crystallin family protein [Chloroflexota bacterium]
MIDDDLDQFEKSVDRFFSSFLPTQRRYRPITWHPPTDVYETDAGVTVKIEIAGMTPEDFEISFQDQVLTVSGERKDLDVNKTVLHLLEITYAEFEIQVKLPGAYLESEIAAKYESGFLYITLPKPKEQKQTPIRIRVK